MAKRSTKTLPTTLPHVEIHFICDEYMTRYRVWSDGWNGQFDLISYQEFAEIERVAKRFNCIRLIDHTDED